MPRKILDQKLLEKLAKKTKKKMQYLREQISRKASRHGISSEAALILWAKEEGIGVATYQRKLPINIQEQVRSLLASSATQKPVSGPRVKKNAMQRPQRSPAQLGIDDLLQDKELRGRCRDLLKASRHFDRVFREATTVLDHRLKSLTGIKRMKPLDLVGKVLNPDPQKAVIEVSDDKAEQEGFYSICKGVVLAFRDPTHHLLSEKFSREDALKFCGFIDAILAVIGQALIHPDRR